MWLLTIVHLKGIYICGYWR